MKIVTDCAADLPEEEAQALGVAVAPLFISFPEGQVNSADITADDFYDRLEAMAPEAPTTAQPSSGVFSDLYRGLVEKDEEVLSIHVSSGLSGTFNAALQGAKDVTPAVVHVFDSMTLSGGQRFQVLAAQRAMRAGWDLKRILTHLERIRAATEVVYTLETLSYLVRGGRIGRVQALAGALLNLKPVIRVDRSDGKYSSVGRARTTLKAISHIAEHLSKEFGETTVWISVMHGRSADQAENLANMLKTRLNIGKLEILRISPVLGVHSGPGIVGAAVMPLELIEEIV